jgi:multiple sugar transport system substrate-binding protein
MVEEYNKSQDDIYLVYKMIPDSSNSMTQMNTMLLAGEEMDITSGQSSADLQLRYTNGLLEPLDEYFTKNGLDYSEIFGEVARSCVTGNDGKIYSMPYAIKNYAIFYNKDIFDNAGVDYPQEGWTWDDLTEIALAVSSGEGADRIYGVCWNFDRIFLRASLDLGLDAIYSDDGLSTTFDDPAWVNSMAWYKNLQDIGAAKPYSEYGELSLTEEANRIAYFYDGKYAMNCGVTYEISNWGELEENAHDFECGVVPLPVDSEGAEQRTLFQFSDISLVSYSKNKDAAFDFMYWYCVERPDVTCGEKAMQAAAPYPDDEEIAKVADEKIYSAAGFDTEECKYAFDNPAIVQRPDYTFTTIGTALPEIRDIMKAEAELVMNGEQTPEQAAANMKTQADEAIKMAQ